MLHGELENTLPPRMLITFEGVIATIPEGQGARYPAFPVIARRYNHAAACYEVNAHVLSLLWDLTWRRGYKSDVITFLGEDMHDGVRHLLDQLGVPLANLWAEDVDALISTSEFH